MFILSPLYPFSPCLLTGTNRAKYCWPGNQMFAALDNDLHFGYQKNGSLVIAYSDEDMVHLEELKKRGEKNGVQRLRIIGKEELFELEPYVNPSAVGALLSPDAGNVIPYEFAIALVENAVDNGVELRIRREVSSIKREGELFTVTAKHWEPKSYLESTSLVDVAASTTAAPLTPSEKSKRKHQNTRNVLNAPTIGVVGGLVSALIKFNLIVIPNGSPVQYVTVGVLLTVFILLGLSVLLPALGGGKEESSSSSDRGSESVDKAPTPVGRGGSKATVDDMRVGGSGSCAVMGGVVVEQETFKATYVINAAGSYSDVIANMIGDHSFKIKQRLGDYLLLNKNQGHLAKHTLFPCPGKLGKGVLVQTTLWGNLILGPTARDTYLPECMNMTDEEVQTFILSKCKHLVPSFDASMVIHAFCGARAKSTRGDWIIEPSQQDPHFIHVAGIDSPGLAGSPAIAVDVVKMLKDAGLKVGANKAFDPKRKAMIVPKNGWNGIRAGPVGKFTDPKVNVVCKCEKVTEAEIVDAIHRSLPVDSTQAIRKRTRAGMGECQGDKENYDCETRVRAIIAREMGVPLNAIGRRPWPATSTLPQRWIEDNHKQRLVELMKAQ